MRDPHLATTNRLAEPTSIRESAAEEAPDLEDYLPDVGLASFGGLQERVFEHDDRVQVTSTEQLPWRVNASLRITAADGSIWLGTGWFVTPRTLITAGHCVFINHSGVPGRDGWVRSIAVMPGRNGSALPFGSQTTTTFQGVDGWTQQADERFDYGAIVLPGPFAGTIGVRRFAVWSDTALNNVEATIVGYPGDKPAGTLWRHALPIHAVEAMKIFYKIDTAGGQSGAALYVMDGGEPVAVGVHTYGGATSNSATRITQEVFDNIRRWSV